MNIKGYYNDGVTSAQHAAELTQLRVAEGVIGLVLLNEGPSVSPVWIHIDEFEVSSRLGSTPREMNFREVELFITDENDAVDDLLARLGKSHGRMHRLERSLMMIGMAVLVTALVGWYLAVAGIPAAAKTIAFQMPDEMIYNSDTTLTLLDKTMFDASELEAEKVKHLTELARPYLLAHASVHPKLNFRVGGHPNAFALPDGNIVFTDEFIDLTENDEEFLAVLFHELGHLQHRHLLRRGLQDSMIALIVILVTGDLNSVDVLVGIPTLMLDLSYSREFEIESDLYALSQMDLNDIPLINFSNIMLRLKASSQQDEDEELGDVELTTEAEASEPGKMSKYFSTHPATVDRVELVETYLREHRGSH